MRIVLTALLVWSVCEVMAGTSGLAQNVNTSESVVFAPSPFLPPRTGKSKTIKFLANNLHGWDGNHEWWYAKEGAYSAKASGRVPTSFLLSKENYSDFRITLWSKVAESSNHAGICFWGERNPQPDNPWAYKCILVVFPSLGMWDYNTNAAIQFDTAGKQIADAVTRQNDWIHVEILAQGNRIRVAYNGAQVLDWREPNPGRLKEGPIGLQLHGFGKPQEVIYKDVAIETFPKEDRLLTISDLHRAGGLLEGIPSGQTRIADLSYSINDKLPGWPAAKGPAFSASVLSTVAEQGYFARKFSMVEHYGTHMDAPDHFAPDKYSIDKVPVQKLFGPAVMIDVREQAAKDPDYRLTLERINQWEATHGRIPEGAIVLLNTGWAQRWPDEVRYSNADSGGTMHYPAFSIEAAKLLIERKVVGLGIDTYGIDYGPSKTYDVHHLVLSANLYAIENLSDLSDVPESGAFIVAAPIKLDGGSGGPCRVFAILPH